MGVGMVVIGSAGLLAPGRVRWLRALGWMVALGAMLLIAFNAVAKATLLLLGSNEPTAVDRLIAAIAGSIAILVVYRLAVGFGERREVGEIGLRKGPADLLVGFAVGGAMMAGIVGLMLLLGWATVESKAIEGIAMALRDSIRSGVVEEMLLRLVIFRLLWRAFGVWPALVSAVLLFGALHLGNPDSSLFAAVCLIAGEGVGIGLYLLTGRIWASIGMHAAWNFTQGWIFGAAVSGTHVIGGGPLVLRPVAGSSELLSGGGFGPEASLAALVVSLLGSGAFLLQAWRSGRFKAADDMLGPPVQPSGKAATSS